MTSQLKVRSVPPFRVSAAGGSHRATGSLEAAARGLLDDVELGRARALEPRPRQDFLGRPAGAAALCGGTAGCAGGGPPAATTVRSAAPEVRTAGPDTRCTVCRRRCCSASRGAQAGSCWQQVPDPAPGLRLGVDVQDPAGTDFAGFDELVLGTAERAGLRSLAGTVLLAERARLWGP